MLQNIRDRSQGWFTTLIIGLVCLTFVLWGAHSFIGSGSSHHDAVTINGAGIAQSQVNAAYERLRQQQQLQLGAAYTPSPELEKQLKQQALNQLISTEILSAAAREQGFGFSVAQAVALVESVPAFQVNGHFAPERFQQMLQNILYTEQSFFDHLRTAMLINQVRVGINNSAFALPTEINQAIQLVNQKRDINYLIIPSHQLLAQAKPTEAAITDYYQQHQAEFKVPEQVSIEYIELSLPELKKTVHLSDAELRQYYQENINNYQVPAHGNLKTAKTLDFAQVKNQLVQNLTQQKAEQLFADQSEKLNNAAYASNNSLAEPAKQLKLAIKSSQLFSADGVGSKQDAALLRHAKVLAAAFSDDVLKAANNSNLIELDAEHAIVLRVKQHQAATVKPLSAVHAQIANKLQHTIAEQKAQQLGDQLLAKIQQGAIVEQLSKTNKLSLTEIKNIGRYDAKVNPQILRTAFRLATPLTGKFSSAGVALQNGDYALVLVSAVHPGMIGAHQNLDSQQRIFNNQLVNSLGQLDYALYVQDLFQHAKIERSEP